GRATQVFDWLSAFLNERAGLVDQCRSNYLAAEQSFHRLRFLRHRAGAGHANANIVTGAFLVETELNRGAGNRKIARNAFQFQINSGAAFIREWEDHFSQYFVALQRSRIGESKEVFRRDDSPPF